MEERDKKIRVLLADDHTIFREGLRSLLEAEDDITIIGESATGRETIDLAGKLQPDVIIMDIGMPEGNGIEASAVISREHPACRVIILSMFDDRAHVRYATDAGVRGYLIKQTAAVDLIKAIHEVHNGHAFFSPSVASALLEKRRSASRQMASSGLTERETDVLKLVAHGKTTPEISLELCISTKTVEKHRQQLMDKLNIHDIAGLTRYALTKGIVKGEGR